MRQTETQIVRALVRSLRAAGFDPVNFFDGEEYVPAETEQAAIDAFLSVDDGTLHFRNTQEPRDKQSSSYGVLLVGGNGKDVIADWHCKNDKFSAAIDAVLDDIDDHDGYCGCGCG